jgi:glycosyltransferase involved in cell wall biosynthesis
MRILMVNKYYFVKGGADRVFIDEEKLLRQQGHIVEVFAMQHPHNHSATYARYFAPYVEYHRTGGVAGLMAAGRVLWSPAAARGIAAVLDDFRPDLVLLGNVYHQLSPSILPPIRHRGIPIVQRLHDYKLICPNYQLYTQGAVCTRCRNHNYFQATHYRCLHGSLAWSLLASVEMTLHKHWQVYERHVNIFIASSLFAKEILQQFGVATPMVHIPNFVFSEWQAHTPSRSTSAADGDYIAYFGRLSPEKGLPTLLRAMRQLPSTRLHIIGDGLQRSYLEQMSAELNLANVTFRGYQEGKALQDALAGARFTVLPSEWLENCPLSILESFAAGKAVVAARIGGIPELIAEGQDGCLFTPGNVDELAINLQTLWDRPVQTRQMGQYGWEKVQERYTPADQYAQVYPLYQRAVAMTENKKSS